MLASMCVRSCDRSRSMQRWLGAWTGFGVRKREILRTGETFRIDLAQDYRVHPAVDLLPGARVLALVDIVTNKVAALLDRRSVQDYADVDRLLAAGWPPRSLAGIAVGVRPDLSSDAMASVLRSAGEIPEEAFVEIGVDPAGLDGRLLHAAAELSLRQDLVSRIDTLCKAPPVATRGEDRCCPAVDLSRVSRETDRCMGPEHG